MAQIRIAMLPVEQWQEARIIKFRYNYLDRPCAATIVYYLPCEIYGDKHDKDLINNLIEESLRSLFGEIYVWRREVFFDNIKGEMQKIYDGGRQKINFVVRMLPEIPVEQYQNYVGKDIFAYDYHLNIQLDFFGQLDKFNKDLLVTVSFPIGQEDHISWGADNIETL